MWVLNQANGRVYRPDGTHAGTIYSGGNAGKSPEGINNHAMQDQHNIGPLPVGLYLIGIPVDNTPLGPFAMPLTPVASNQMFGRSGLYFHGDNFAMNQSASDGCMIGANTLRHEMWDSGDRQLAVVYLPGLQ